MSTFPHQSREGIDKVALVDIIGDITEQVQAKLDVIKAKATSASIGDMFDMQMLMNRLSQISEMSTSVMSALNTAIMSMARNIKG